MRDTSKRPGELGHRGRGPKEHPDRRGKTGYRRFWRNKEWSGTE